MANPRGRKARDEEKKPGVADCEKAQRWSEDAILRRSEHSTAEKQQTSLNHSIIVKLTTTTTILPNHRTDTELSRNKNKKCR